ncbi:MAG: hypothetical protein EOO23_03455 [Comamonadaceae bacterium]|nr:MAG: hypothetical protein EOO23_03455 [Comamonadaceae bacterium]
MARPTDRENRRQLDLLSYSGAGLGPLAPSLAKLLCDIIGGESCVIGWGYQNGAPNCGYAQVATPSTLDCFTNQYQSLFLGAHEYTSAWIAAQTGYPVGKMLNPDRRFFRSNTFNLMIRGIALHHTLDLRVDVGGITEAVVGLFRPVANPFSETDAERLMGLLPALQRISANRASEEQGHVEAGYLLVDSGGDRILMADESASRLLRASFLVGHQIPVAGPIEHAPLFVRKLCRQLQAQPASCPTHLTEVAGGTLRATARYMGTTAADPPEAASILVALQITFPGVLDIVDKIARLKLSPMQGRIALYAARGGRRKDCAHLQAVSQEALKKHLRHIYAATGTSGWDELSQQLTQQ